MFLKVLELAVKYFNRQPFELGIAAVASGKGSVRRIEILFGGSYGAIAEAPALWAGLLAKDLPSDLSVLFAFKLLLRTDAITCLRSGSFDVAVI